MRTAMGHWVVEGDHGVSRLVAQHGTFMHPENLRDLFLAALCVPEGGVVVDAGACIGDQTVPYAQMVGADGLVYAFEPHPQSYQALVKNVAHLTNVRTYEAALNSNAMQLYTTFSLTPSNIGASFVGLSEEFQSVVARTTTLDVALDGISRLDFIHLDAEGMESQILKGATGLIEQFRPSLMVEVCDAWLRRCGSSSMLLMQQLAQLGYMTLLQAQINPAQFDVIAMPTQRLAGLTQAGVEAVYAQRT